VGAAAAVTAVLAGWLSLGAGAPRPASPGGRPVADQRVRVVAARAGRFYGIQMKAGYIYTIAGPFPGSQSVAVDGHGNVEVLDTVESVVRLMASGPARSTASR
jgi:hypothetical protein